MSTKPCNIKDSGKAWNDGVDAFKKAFKQTGGKTTESIKFAIDEIKRQNPDFDFDIDSFTKPLISSLKEKSLISKDYSFKKGTSSETKINRVAEKMSGLSPDQKKDFARKSWKKFNEDGLLTEQGVKNIYSEAIGVPAMNEKVEAQIKKTSDALTKEKEVEDKIQVTIKKMQEDKTANDGELTPELNEKYSKELSDLADRRAKAKNDTMRESAAFAGLLKEKKFWLHQLSDYMPLNLMNPNSLMKNVSGAFADAITRTVGNSIASPISELAKFATGINSNPIFAKAKGAIKSKMGDKAKLAWKYGQTDFQSEIPKSNHLSAVNRFKEAMNAKGFESFKGILSAALKIHPNLISKGLTVPDAMAYEAVYSSEMNRIAEAKGLKGAEKKAFLLDPDEKSDEVATKLAEKATFKQELPQWASGIKKFSAYDPHEATKKLIEKGMSPLAAKMQTGLRNILQKSAVPFIKTPINILRTSSKILLPEYELGHALLQAKNETDPIEKQRLIIEGTTKAAAAFYIRNVAIQMVAQGLISAGYDDEDPKVKDAVEQKTGGPNRINISALIRALTFQDIVKEKKGDKYIDLNSMGALGIVFAVYANAYNRYDKNEIENRTSYSKDLLNSVKTPWDLGWSALTSSLDFTFFTGINEIMAAVKDKQGYERKKYAITVIKNMLGGIVPATAQKFSTQVDPNVKKQFSKEDTFNEALMNMFDYNFLGKSDKLKNKYFSLAEEGKGGLKKKQHMLFDNYWGRVLESELDFVKLTDAQKEGSPVSKLYNEMKSVPKEDRDKFMPSAISQTQTIETRKRGKKLSDKVKLTDDQYDYLQQQASVHRMMLATPFIMSEEFKKADFETKTKVLQSLYSEGLKNAKKDLKDKYPDVYSGLKQTAKQRNKEAKELSKKFKHA